MMDKQRSFALLLAQGVSISEACRRLAIDRETGHWWKNGGVIVGENGNRVVESVLGRFPERQESGRYLSEAERVRIAEGVDAGKSARAIAASWAGRRRRWQGSSSTTGRRTAAIGRSALMR